VKPLLGWRGGLLPLLRDPIGHMMRLQRTYGDVVALAEGTSPGYVFVFSPEYNHQVLSDQALFFNGAVNAPGSPIRIPPGSPAYRLFSGLTTMNAGKHTQQRRLLMPAFHKKRIEGLRDRMVEMVGARLDAWQVGQELDLLQEMKSLTLAVAVRAILGLDPEREGDRVRRLMERWLRLALSPAVVALPFNVPGLPFHRLLSVAGQVEVEVRAMTARRASARRRALGAGESEGTTDALSMLLAAHDEDGTRLTGDELVGQTTTLFVAGHETTATALTWTLFLLAQHPDVLSALLDEFAGVLHGQPPTVEQMQALPLLDAVINESMRLVPPGLWFLRIATAPTRFGPYDVPEGTRVLWSPAVTHRRPELYPQPEKFLPERWQSIDPSPYEYMPFGAGPRRCIGATFAIMEMKVVLPMLLQRYGLQLRPGARIALGGSPLASPRYGMPMRVTPPTRAPQKTAITGNIRSLIDL
jgi:cytochrome P450